MAKPLSWLPSKMFYPWILANRLVPDVHWGTLILNGEEIQSKEEKEEVSWEENKQMTVTCASALMTSGNTACDQNLKKHSLSSAVHGGRKKKERKKDSQNGGKHMLVCPSAPLDASLARAEKNNLLGAVLGPPQDSGSQQEWNWEEHEDTSPCRQQRDLVYVHSHSWRACNLNFVEKWSCFYIYFQWKELGPLEEINNYCIYNSQFAAVL